MWDKLKDKKSVERGLDIEKQLHAERGFWGDMVDLGSRIFRHNNTHGSAIEIVDYIMHLKYPAVLDIQRQMIDEHLKLDQTTAGQEVQRELLLVKRQYEDELEETRKQMEIAIKDGDERMANKLAKMEDDYKEKIKKSDEDRQQLQANFEKIQKAKDEETKAKIAELQDQARKYQKEAEANLEAVEKVKWRQAESDEKLEQIRQENKEAATKFEAERDEREKEYQRKEQEWMAEMERKTKELQEKSKSSASVAALLALGIVGLGIVTANPVLIGAGGTMLAGSSGS
jgi:thiol:disulfide interchange protein